MTGQGRRLWIKIKTALGESPAMEVEGIHVEDICQLVSLVIFLIISWTITFRILANEEDQYTVNV